MLVWFATLASKKEIEARLDALEATVAAQNATIAALRDNKLAKAPGSLCRSS